MEFFRPILLAAVFLSGFFIAFIVNMWIRPPKSGLERTIEEAALIVKAGRGGWRKDINYWLNVGYLKFMNRSKHIFVMMVVIFFSSLLILNGLGSL